MSLDDLRENRTRTALRTAAVTGPGWAVGMFLINGGDVNLPALVFASLLFGAFMGAYMYWNIGKRLAEGTGDELLLSHSRTLAVAAPLADVFARLRGWLRTSDDYTLGEADEEFGTLRAKRHGKALHLGEEVSIHLAEQGGGTAIRIISHTASPVQMVDNGFNKRNVDEIAGLLVDSFEIDTPRTTRPESQRVPKPQEALER